MSRAGALRGAFRPWWRTRADGPRPDLQVGRGERLLAWARTDDGRDVGGTRDALYVSVDGSRSARLRWERVDAADWDAETSTLAVTEADDAGRTDARVVHRFRLDDGARLLELVRERVTASVLLQRHVPLAGRRGVRVVARRAPGGGSGVTWVFQYDEGVDPADPVVQAAAAEALASARDAVGLG